MTLWKDIPTGNTVKSFIGEHQYLEPATEASASEPGLGQCNQICLHVPSGWPLHSWTIVVSGSVSGEALCRECCSSQTLSSSVHEPMSWGLPHQGVELGIHSFIYTLPFLQEDPMWLTMLKINNINNGKEMTKNKKWRRCFAKAHTCMCFCALG